MHHLEVDGGLGRRWKLLWYNLRSDDWHLRSGFTSFSVAQFGGVQATSVKLYGANLLEAKVPAGALTGSVTVTTNEEFRVTPQLLNFSAPSGPWERR